MQESDGRRTANQADASSSAARERTEDASTLRIPVLVEELVADKTPISLGTVHLHKGIRTEEQTLRIPTFHEEATIEHLSAEALGEEVSSADPDVLIIPIYEEQVVVEKRTVLKEYIRITKRRVETERVLRETVRREYVDVTGLENGQSMRVNDG